jgi:hypothetical protein
MTEGLVLEWSWILLGGSFRQCMGYDMGGFALKRWGCDWYSGR